MTYIQTDILGWLLATVAPVLFFLSLWLLGVRFV